MSVSFVDCVCSFYVWPVLNCVSVTIEFSVWSIVMIVESNAWDWVYMFVCVCVCESVKISCPWTWIFNHTYGSTLGCIIIHSLFVEVVLSTHFFDFPFPVFNLVVFFPLPSLLHTRACIRILLIYVLFFVSLFEAQRELWLQINEPSVFLWWRTELRDPVGDAQPKDFRLGQYPIAILMWYILH